MLLDVRPDCRNDETAIGKTSRKIQAVDARVRFFGLIQSVDEEYDFGLQIFRPLRCLLQEREQHV